MKILILMSGSYPPKEGIGSHVYSLSKQLVDNGNQVTVVSRRHDLKTIQYIKDKGINFVLVPIINIPFVSTLLFGRYLEKKFKNEVFDVVHYHSPLVPYANLNTLRKIVTIHSTMKVDTSFIEAISFNAILNKIMGKFLSPIIEKKLMMKCDEIIIVCREIKDELIKAYQYKNLKTHYIHNGIDNDLFNNLDLTRKKQILYVGRLGYRKGIPNLLKALKKIQNIIRQNGYSVILCGNGHLFNFCESFIRNNNLNDIVKLTQKSQDELNTTYNESKFLIMNSTYETGPRTILESIYTNTPFIATKVGLIHSIKKEDYIPVEDFTVEAVANSIVKAICNIDDNEYEFMKSQINKYKDAFDNEKLTNKIMKLYES